MKFQALFCCKMGRVGDEQNLKVLVALRRSHIALRTFEKLPNLFRNSVMTSVRELIDL